MSSASSASEQNDPQRIISLFHIFTFTLLLLSAFTPRSVLLNLRPPSSASDAGTAAGVAVRLLSSGPQPFIFVFEPLYFAGQPRAILQIMFAHIRRAVIRWVRAQMQCVEADVLSASIYNTELRAR